MRTKLLIIAVLLSAVFASSSFVSFTSAYSANTYVNQSTGTISFSGYAWYAESTNSRTTMYPVPNHWSSSSSNVWVDSNGWLHLQLTMVRNVWYCVNLNTVQALGYGTYSFVISNNAATMDKNVVLGLFSYLDDNHEADIEFSTWGVRNANNAWYTVQPPPYILGYNEQSFMAKLSGSYSTHFFTWAQNSAFFESLQGETGITSPPPSSVIYSFTSPVSPSAIGAQANINLWLLNGHAPSNGKTVAVVVKSFNFVPASH